MSDRAMRVVAFVLLGCGLAGEAPKCRAATSEQIVYSFKAGKDARSPDSTLLNINGTLYGTSEYGGKKGQGTVFSLTPAGVEKILYSFEGVQFGATDGATPKGGVIALNGSFFGTTHDGGVYDNGTVFQIDSAGKETVIYSFQGSSVGGHDGSNPSGALIDIAGTLYGTTDSGGEYGDGTVFTMTQNGQENILYSFRGNGNNGSDGEGPSDLISIKGVLYGTTVGGGVFGGGTFYSLTKAGVETNLHSFANGSDGNFPTGALLYANGMLYGTTNGGGLHSSGTVFSITTAGTEAVIYSFGSFDDGGGPFGNVTELGGVLYGTTSSGTDTLTSGTIFGVTLAGAEVYLYPFKGVPDGDGPVAGLILAGPYLYGTTFYGGKHNEGTVYKVKP